MRRIGAQVVFVAAMLGALGMSASPAFAVVQPTHNGGLVQAGGTRFPSDPGGFGGALIKSPSGQRSFQGGFGTDGGGCGGRIDISTDAGVGSCYH
jgi:hypothetical protein